MDARQIEVHSYYKGLYPDALILYRFPGRYMVLGEDVDRARKSFPDIKVPAPGVGYLPGDLTVISTLGADGTEVRAFQYRNDSGELDLPDVSRIRAEKEQDL